MLPYHERAIMRSLAPSRFALTFLVAGAAMSVALGACATDNGPTFYGETFGPLPERRDGGAIGADGGPLDRDGSAASPDGAVVLLPDSGACPSGILAVLSGSDTSLTGAVQDEGGGWTTTALTGASKSLPSLVAGENGFLGVVRSTSDAVASVAFGVAWSGPSSIPGATTIGTPALAPSGATTHLAIHTPAFEHAYGVTMQTTWTAASEALQPAQGAKSFGPSAPAIAATGGEVVVAYDGDDGGLYLQSRPSTGAGGWGPPAGLIGAGVHKPVPPVLVPWEGGRDLVVLFADGSQDHVIRHATRTAGAKTWSAVANTGALAFTAEAFRAARLSTTQLLVAYRGADTRAYAMVGTFASDAFSWTAPVPLFASAAVDGAPAVARGVCGDDAVAVASTGGAVRITRLRGASAGGGAWSAPADVPGLPGGPGTRLAVAARAP